MNYALLVPFLLYFLVIISIGIYYTRFSSAGLSEFFLGGRKLSGFVTAVSAVISGRSAWLLFIFTGQAYIMGLSAIWAVVGYTIIELFLFYYYAPRLRKYSEDNHCITIPDYFSSRFGDESGLLRLIISVIFLFFLLSNISALFIGGGEIFFSLIGISNNSGLIITGLIIFAYTFTGGFLAVSITDVLQAFILMFILIILPLWGIEELRIVGMSVDLGKIGDVSLREHIGLRELISSIKNSDGTFFNPLAFGTGSMIGLLSIGLGSSGNPQVLVRYMAIRDQSQLKKAGWIGVSINIVLALGALMTGFVARAYFPSLDMLPGSDPGNAYIFLAREILPKAYTGIFLAAVFSSIMSTVDSQLLVATSSVVRDLYEKLIMKNKCVSQKRLILLSRIMLAILIYSAILIGRYAEGSIIYIAMFSWAGLGAAIGPPLIQSLSGPQTTRTGVIAGMLSGLFMVVIWKSIPGLSGYLYELVPGFLMAWVVTWRVSLIRH